jgi:hypothetical protein
VSFEYNQDDNLLNGFPNPFRFENIFLGIGAIAMLTGGIASIVHAREFFKIHEDKAALAVLALAMLVLSLAVKLLIQALSQLRFYLGRKFPRGLAGELAVTETGLGEGVDEILNTLRHRMIEFPEPKGALNGILYSLVKGLVTSPTELQAVAVQHFQSLLASGALLTSLIVSYVIFAGTPCEGFASWCFLPMSGLSLMTPFMQPERLSLAHNTSDQLAGVGDGAVLKLIALVVFSIMAPVLIPRVAPHFAIVPMWTPPVLLLAGSIITSMLVFGAILCRLDNVSSTNVSCEQTVIGMNCPPAQLWTAISRDFHRSWERGIPNRAYANVPPDVSQGERGSFSGLVLEETQPIPTSTLQFSTWAEVFQTPYSRLLIALGSWGVAMAVSCAWAAAKSTEQFVYMSRMEISRSILIVMALGMVAALSFQIGHLLWSRMQFRSRLVWIETCGVFQASRISVGSKFRGYAQSSSTLTRVEDATLRVWVADIVSVAFGKDGKRSIISMAPADHIAKSMTDRLVDFVASQSVVATPTASADLTRSSTISRLDAAVRVATTNAREAAARGQSLPENLSTLRT